MTDIELFRKIKSGIYSFEAVTFDGPISLNYLSFFNDNNANDIEITLTFKDCIFNSQLSISNIKGSITILFAKCKFDSITISFCNIRQIAFAKILHLKSLEIVESSLGELHISDTSLQYSNIKIIGANVTGIIYFRGLKIEEGEFALIINRNNEKTINSKILICESTFDKFDTNYSYFGNSSELKKIKANTVNFNNCTFNNNSFIEMDCKKIHFLKCTFINSLNFRNSINKSNIIFNESTFNCLSHFNDSKILNLEIRRSTFDKKASFDKVEVDSINFHQTSFNQGAFFDELKINKIHDSKYFKNLKPEEAQTWRRTLRLIKQELQKSENRIDYNRFRSYELQAYYQELNWKWKEGFKDKFILWATKWSTGFDHKWTQALCFILISCLVFYTTFFISENYMLSFDLASWKSYASGYFRFLIVTDFYNPLEDGRTFIDNTNTIGWFIFILGKIVIAFGIYEMIQAFRKFKA